MMPPPEPPVLCQSPGADRNRHASAEVLSVCSQLGQGAEARPVSQTGGPGGTCTTGQGKAGRAPAASAGPGQTLTRATALQQPEQKHISRQGGAPVT